MTPARDHGGGLDAAIAQYGGHRSDWLDLSTGINPEPYPLGQINAAAWTDLPDQNAFDKLEKAARGFWNIPDNAAVIAAPGASALIARMPELSDQNAAFIPGPTYNEHAAAFRAAERHVSETDRACPIHVYVHPNNPDGQILGASDFSGASFTVIDESFCDVIPERSHTNLSSQDGVVILKSFGKFWGLAGLRLGFAIGSERTLTRMKDLIGPWAVSGPALQVGAQALEDHNWATATRSRLAKDAKRLDDLMQTHGKYVGGTDLYRLYDVGDAKAFQNRLAQNHIWSRTFPYSETWLRLGLPAADRWAQLEAAL